MNIDGKSLFIIIFSVILIFSIILGVPKLTFALTTNQTNITVNVSMLTEITVHPNILSWTQVAPGSTGGMKYLDIENTGSTNISKVYAYTDTIQMEPTSPLGSDNSTKYAAAGVLVLKKNETGALYYYAGRLEWNTSKPTAAGGANCQNAVAWGYYRNATGEYLWCLTNGTDGYCNNTAASFYIEQDADNGTAATRQPDTSGGTVQPEADWGLFSFTNGGPLNGTCVAAYRDCTKIYLYRYDRRTSPNFGACPGLSNDEKSIVTETLAPHDTKTINLDVWVPEGMPYGDLRPSILTLEAGT